MLAHLIWLGPGCEGGRDQNLRSRQGKLSGPSLANICFQACTAPTGGCVLGRFYRPCSAWGRALKPAAAVNECHAANETAWRGAAVVGRMTKAVTSTWWSPEGLSLRGTFWTTRTHGDSGWGVAFNLEVLVLNDLMWLFTQIQHQICKVPFWLVVYGYCFGYHARKTCVLRSNPEATHLAFVPFSAASGVLFVTWPLSLVLPTFHFSERNFKEVPGYYYLKWSWHLS